jgi:hypothetical protein
MGLVLGGVFLVATLARAVASNGPYYAMPAWDQKLPASTRFVVLTDWSSQAVLDRETGLVWEQAPATTAQSWADTRTACFQSTKGGRKGWRLPSIAELFSLIDPSASNPALPAGHPFTNVQLSNYWSGTTDAVIPSNAWGLNFVGGAQFSANKSVTIPVWCVRGAMQENVY